MELNRKLAQTFILFGAIFLVSAWQCKTLNCLIHPLSLRLWKDHIELSTRTLRVKAGSTFSITCDGSCVGSLENPHLRWYGPDRHWIAYEGVTNRVHVEQSFSRQFLKLYIRRVSSTDEGEYICRGWLGSERGWDQKTIRLIVDQKAVPTTVRPVTTEPITSTTQPSTRLVTTTTVRPPTTEEPCSYPNFKCGTGECLDESQVCDTVPDCEDGSDERSCAAAVCNEGMIACVDGSGCVTSSQICDGVVQCRDGSDEDPNVCSYK